MAGKFVIDKSTKSQLYFNLKAGNGEIILTSELYKAKSGVLNGIDSVRENAPLDNRYERKDNSQYSFNLKAKNGQVIGRSETYTTRASREKGIEAVKKNAPDAVVNDLGGEE